ncbi:CU044_2847 family protein [Streptomyces sp. 8N706]|uniref:CU044_2847 family protein n=1 Tax=Streptomyces sp. 8N706 TaxID=3457416 RepID=UPI003FD6BFD2
MVRLELDDGGSVLVEVPDDGPAVEPAGRPGRVVDTANPAQTATETLQAALGRIRPAIEAVVGQVRGLGSPPDKVSVQFGIKITAEAGAVIAKASTEANFTVSAEWTRAAPPPSPPRLTPPAPRSASDGS